MKMCFKLIGIEKRHPVTKANDSSFLLLIQRAALLGLKDTGYLTEMQHRQADEALLRLYKTHNKAICSEEICND